MFSRVTITAHILVSFVIIPPYGSMVGILGLLCLCWFVCTVTEKDSGVKLCTLVGLLSRQVSSHFGELRFACSHGGGVTSGMNELYTNRTFEKISRRSSVGSGNWGRRRRVRICVLQAC